MKMQPTQKRDQLAFDWNASMTPGKETVGLFGEPATVSAGPVMEEVKLAPKSKECPVEPMADVNANRKDTWLVRVLPWDFRSSFPEPVGEKFHQALPGASDQRTAVIKEYHDRKAQQGLVLLAGMDQLVNLQQSGIDPNSDEPLTNAETTESLRQQLQQEIRKSEEAFDKLVGVYAAMFGKPAGEAFRAAIRVWHLGGAVITPLPPVARALAEAVNQAHFGYEEDGRIVHPSEEEVLEITAELADYLRDVDDPDLRNSLLHQYTNDFGHAAANALDQWTRCINQAEEDGLVDLQFDPGHPWHYCSEGDAAEPMLVDQIPAGPCYDLPTAPKNLRKRLEFLQQMLVEQEQQLDKDRNRYTELVDKGVEALSDYDRNIAHDGNDDLAWASAIALKFNHIRYGQARVAALRTALVMPPA